MNEIPFTDARLARDLRALVPAGAPSGLHDRIRVEVEETAQQRRMPGPLGLVTNADPFARRRTLLLLAAALLVAGLAVTGVVGALLADRAPQIIPELSLEQPPDMPAFVQSTYQRMPQLPPMTIVAFEDGVWKQRILVDGEGSVRAEQYATPDATEPVSYRLFVGTTMAEVVIVDGRPRWHEQVDAISEDPRVFVFAAMGEANRSSEPGCETAISPGETYASPPSRLWRWLGSETIAGRSAHHVACGGELWIDAETRLTLKSLGPALDDARQPIPGRFHTIEATEIAFGEPPAELFELRPPSGVATVDDATYSCAMDPYCSASPKPVVTPPPAAGEVQPPADLDALAAASRAATDDPPAFDVTVDRWSAKYPGGTTRGLHDGGGRYRHEQTSEASPDPPAITLSGKDYYYVTELTTDGVQFWRDIAAQMQRRVSYPLRLPDACAGGWTFVGVDDIHGRTADHTTCAGLFAPDEYWIDRETRLVLRTQLIADELYGTTVEEVTDLHLGPQPPELFELPPDADLRP
jgi:hypothetical protein